MDVKVGLWRKLSTKKLMLLNCGCWRRLLRVLWTARRSSQSILKEISPGYSLEGLVLKLKLQYFRHLMWRVDSLEKTLMLGGIGGRRRRGWQRMRWLDGITDSMGMSLSNSGRLWWTGRPGVLRFMGSQRVEHDWTTKLNWRSDPVNHDGVITHLEPDILECEVKWVLGSIITNKASGGDGISSWVIPVLKDDAVKVLNSICQQIWATQQWPQDWRRSVFIPVPKKGNAKECSIYCTVALISHTSKVMLKILQARLH